VGGQGKLDSQQETHLIALTCSTQPHGCEHWTLRLLADEAVKLEFAELIAPEALRKILKKVTSSRGKNKNGAFPR
jgi:hypothetical protein